MTSVHKAQVATNGRNGRKAMHVRARPQVAIPVDDMKRLAAVGISVEDWLRSETADDLLATRLFAVLQTSLEEMQQLATMLDLYVHMSHDSHGAASPHPVRDDVGIG
ncbi:MAG TPA: hypothetical protein VFW17_00675 [Ktedonobacterales bacterium]|nr:hypothetical protein [Ktedonobacterales bacterium]